MVNRSGTLRAYVLTYNVYIRTRCDMRLMFYTSKVLYEQRAHDDVVQTSKNWSP